MMEHQPHEEHEGSAPSDPGSEDGGPGRIPAGVGRQASETWESLFRAQVAVMRRLRQDPAFRELPIGEYDVLFNLSRYGDAWVRLNELNHHLLISQPSLSRMVDRLEAKDLVAKRPARNDHRGVELSLTEHGRTVQRQIGSAHVRRIQETLVPCLDAEEMAQLKTLTDRINARLAGEG